MKKMTPSTGPSRLPGSSFNPRWRAFLRLFAAFLVVVGIAVNLAPAHGQISATASINAGILYVTPETGFGAQALPGGPFNPGHETFTLKNTGNAPLTWTAADNVGWLDLSASGGTIAPGASTTVDASINSQASQLGSGLYAAAVKFVNTSGGLGNTSRKVLLNVARAARLVTTWQALLGGQLAVRVEGNPLTSYVLESSLNLYTWTPVVTNRTSVDGWFEYREPLQVRAPKKFYRAISQPAAYSVQALASYQSDRILLKPKPGVAAALLDSLHMLTGVSVLKTYPAIGNLQVLQLPAGVNLGATLASYLLSGLVEYAEPDSILQVLATPNDFRYTDGSLWHLNNIGQGGGKPDADIDAPEAWEIQKEASTVIVAVIDTGVRYTHEDLAANIWVNPGEVAGNGGDDDSDGFIDDVHGINAITGSGDPMDDHGHGSHVSGIIGGVGNNQVGVVGVCWQAQILACKFLDAEGSGTVSDAIRCIDFARSKGARVINASWGTTGFNSPALRDAIVSARDADIIFVAAAGNSAEDNSVDPIYPATFDVDNIISVAATTRTDDLAAFSNYGATTVHLGAPGSPIFSCWGNADDAYQFLDGTSMAAATVSGACTLLRAKFPNETYRQIINRVLASVDPLPSLQGKCTSGGRLNLLNAMGSVTPPPQPTVTVIASDASATEAGDTGTFTISRVGDTSTAITVSFTLGGTADNGSDYLQLASSITIPAGAVSATLTVTPIDDAQVEGDETVILTIANGTTYTVGSPNSATITISDNDQNPPPMQTVTVIASDATASESGDTGTFTINRTGDTSAALTVNYSLSGTASNGADYQQLGTSATIPAGSSSANIVVTPIDDNQVEDSETVVLTLSGSTAYNVGSPGNATIIITDNDSTPPPTPTVTVVASDANASESGDTGTFTINRTGDTSAALTVNYSLSGTASNGGDYQQLGTSVTIPAGSSSANIMVTPIDDNQVEGNETVILSLTGNSAYTVASPSSATVTITDNDSTPPGRSTITVVATDLTASESGDPGVFTISRAGDTSTALAVRYSLGGTAINGVDYQPLSGSVIIPAGASSVDVVIRPINDSTIELAELVVLTLTPDNSYDLGLLTFATVTILDNDLLLSKP